jgi:hypothetical protein
MSGDEHTYLILYGAPSGPVRKVIHIGHERDGQMYPRCNTHMTATHDAGPRQFREATGAELAFRVCGRCTNDNYRAWRDWR